MDKGGDTIKLNLWKLRVLTKTWPFLAEGYSHLPIAHDQDSVTAENSAKAMRNDQHCTALEALPYGILDQGFCLHIDGRRGFINKDDLEDTRSREANLLRLQG